jgi:pimeloyl-ACP methyl ester carboxylesterase
MTSGFEEAKVDGRALRYICSGDGAPPVVVDQGQGLSIERGFDRSVMFGWAKVFTEIQRSTRILMHDRAGLGSSDGSDLPRGSVEMVRDLRAILSAAHVQPPYVLVGHSIGGLNVQTFAAQFPREVAGVVLVDSSHPDQVSRMAKMSAENIDLDRCAEQARALTTLGSKPLVVVSQSPRAFGPPGIPGAVWEKMRVEWSGLQNSLLSLSANSRQRVAGHAGHNVQAEEPQLVIDAILEVVIEVRAGAPRTH